MKKLFKSGWFVLGVLLVSGFMYSCENDEDDNGNGTTDPNTIASANLIAYFPFDDEPAAGEVVEYSNNSITFVRKAGDGSFVDGRRGNAYQGSETENYLEYDIAASSPFSTLDEFTLTCWIKTPVTTTGAAKIFSINGGDPFMGNVALIQESQPQGDSVDLKLYLFDSESEEWKGQDIRINKSQFLNDKWFHLAALYRKSSSTMEFFANGEQVFSQVKYAGPLPESGSQPLLEDIALGSDMSKIYFGAWPQQLAGTPESWMLYYKGLVDEFRIYNKALTEDEIGNLYEAEVSQINE